MDASSPNSETAATVAKAAIAGSKNSMSQMASGVLSLAEKMALDTSARLQLIIAEKGIYNGYADSLGSGFMEAASVGKEVLGYNYGIMVKAKPDDQQKAEMKAAINQSFASMASPEQGGIWAADAIHFQEMVDNGTDLDLVRLLMTAKQKQNLAMVQQNKERAIKLQTEGNAQNLQQASKAKLQEQMQSAQIEKDLITHTTNENIRLAQAQSSFKTENQVVVQQQKSNHKQNETVLKSTLE